MKPWIVIAISILIVQLAVSVYRLGYIIGKGNGEKKAYNHVSEILHQKGY